MKDKLENAVLELTGLQKKIFYVELQLLEIVMPIVEFYLSENQVPGLTGLDMLEIATFSEFRLSHHGLYLEFSVHTDRLDTNGSLTIPQDILDKYFDGNKDAQINVS